MHGMNYPETLGLLHLLLPSRDFQRLICFNLFAFCISDLCFVWYLFCKRSSNFFIIIIIIIISVSVIIIIINIIIIIGQWGKTTRWDTLIHNPQSTKMSTFRYITFQQVFNRAKFLSGL